jgi:acyl-CoA thioester hydrolase
MTTSGSKRHAVQEHVRWSDVDASSIIRWSAYTRFVELAETELFREIGYPYATLWDQLDIWLPRVQFHLDCRNPARLDELIDVEIWVSRIGRSSIRFEFAMKKADGPPLPTLCSASSVPLSHQGRGSLKTLDVGHELKEADVELAAEGYLVVVAISRDKGRSVEVPHPLVEALKPYVTLSP